MGKRICPFCKEKVKQDATICKHCRSELAPLPPKKKSQWAGLLLILIIVAFFSGVFEEKPSSTSLTESDETFLSTEGFSVQRDREEENDLIDFST